MNTRSLPGFVLLTALITGCAPTSNDAAPQPETTQPEPAPAQPVIVEPPPSATPEVSASPELLQQCIFGFDDPSGEALFICGERYSIMILPVAPSVDPRSIFALRVEEAHAIFAAMHKSNIEIEELPAPPTRAGETAVSYRVSFDGGPSDVPMPLVMLHSEADGQPKFVYGVGSKTPTELSFEAELEACTSFVRAVHDADDPKSLVANEEQAGQTP